MHAVYYEIHQLGSLSSYEQSFPISQFMKFGEGHVVPFMGYFTA